MSIPTNAKLLKIRRTRIVATIGPASQDPATIETLAQVGVNVFRLNMSHGERSFHQQAYRTIRETAKRMRITIAVMADLCGPKIRTGAFEGGKLLLSEGKKITVSTRKIIGNEALISSTYQKLANDVAPGDHIMLKDGLLELRVESVAGTEIACTVLRGGTVFDHSGINLPNVQMSTSCITEKDRQDARFAAELGVDFLALSFVQEAEDVLELRRFLRQCRSDTAIIAKIERPQALKNAASILKTADGIMVARGDLGVELPPEQVPIVQHELIQQALSACKPVIVATQMLESMIQSARPTRAEVTDVAHAVTDGADAIMLSAETAMGEHPVESVRIMDRICRQTEAYLWRKGSHTGSATMPRRIEEPPAHVGEAIARTTAALAQELGVRAVAVLARTGASAAAMSAVRPAAPVIVITGEERIQRRLLLHWGIIPLLEPSLAHTRPAELAELAELARRVAREQNLSQPGEFILLVSGFHADPKTSTPSVTAIMT